MSATYGSMWVDSESISYYGRVIFKDDVPSAIYVHGELKGLGAEIFYEVIDDTFEADNPLDIELCDNHICYLYNTSLENEVKTFVAKNRLVKGSDFSCAKVLDLVKTDDNKINIPVLHGNLGRVNTWYIEVSNDDLYEGLDNMIQLYGNWYHFVLRYVNDGEESAIFVLVEIVNGKLKSILGFIENYFWEFDIVKEDENKIKAIMNIDDITVCDIYSFDNVKVDLSI